MHPWPFCPAFTIASAFQEVDLVMPILITTLTDKRQKGTDDPSYIVLAEGSVVNEDHARMV